jgi:hypothetical protein
MSKIILLNGPIKCGKNTAVARIKDLMETPVVDRRCKDHLFTLTQQFFCLTPDEFFTIYNNRALKEKPLPAFAVSIEAYNAVAPVIGASPYERVHLSEGSLVTLSVRGAMIYVSEVICKPTFGQDYFGKARARTIGLSGIGECAIDDSCGFDGEIPPTTDKVGMGNTMLIRIRGRGDFNGDSRRFISDGVVTNTVDIYNEGTEEEFLQEVSELAVAFYNKG